MSALLFSFRLWTQESFVATLSNDDWNLLPRVKIQIVSSYGKWFSFRPRKPFVHRVEQMKNRMWWVDANRIERLTATTFSIEKPLNRDNNKWFIDGSPPCSTGSGSVVDSVHAAWIGNDFLFCWRIIFNEKTKHIPRETRYYSKSHTKPHRTFRLAVITMFIAIAIFCNCNGAMRAKPAIGMAMAMEGAKPSPLQWRAAALSILSMIAWIHITGYGRRSTPQFMHLLRHHIHWTTGQWSMYCGIIVFHWYQIECKSNEDNLASPKIN